MSAPQTVPTGGRQGEDGRRVPGVIKVLWIGIEPTDYLRDEIEDLIRHTELSVQTVFLTEQHSQDWQPYGDEILISSEKGRFPTMIELLRFCLDLPRRDFDVVLLEGYSPWHLVVISFLLHAWSQPYVLRSDTPPRTSGRPFLKQLILRLVVSNASWSLPGGTPQRQNLLEAGADASTCTVGFMGVSNDRFRSLPRRAPTDGLALVGIGRLIERKGWLVVVEALRELRARGENVRLVIVGDGPMRPRLEAMADSLGDALRIYGPATQREIARIMSESDAFILAAWDEPWGLVVNEALASGLPVVVGQDVGCRRDLVVEGLNGMVVDPTDSQSVVSAIERFLRKPEVVHEMSLEALKMSDRWGPDRRRMATADAIRKALILS